MESEDEFAQFEVTEPAYDLLPMDVFLALRPVWWWYEGNCHSDNAEHIDKFYPETTAHGGNHLTPARKMCLACPVRYECLAFGIDEQWGVWGGHSPSQRRRISSMVKKGSTLIEASRIFDSRSRDAR